MNSSWQLQWGHVFVDVEIAVAVSMRAFVSAASMGPRLCRRGNITPPYREGGERRKLQWGHVFVDVEIAFLGALPTFRTEGFNGATSL